MLSQEQLDQLISDLTGTCKSLEDGMNGIELSEYDLSTEDAYALDEQIFRCETCGWWFEVEEMSDNQQDGQICNGCAEDWVNN